MLSELDIELQGIMDRLTAIGGPLQTVSVDHCGRPLPAFRHASPSLPALFALYCRRYHDREFLVDDAVRLTFGQTYALAQRTAAGLVTRHGVRRGDRVGIAASNSANWIVAYMGVLMAGGCATLLNAWWTGDELAHAIALAECDLVLTDAERAARLENEPLTARVVVFSDGDSAAGLTAIAADTDEPVELPEMIGEDIATILFTSGSTGPSKAAVSDHRAVAHAAMNIAGQALMLAIRSKRYERNLEQGETALLCVPLFHATGEVLVLLMSFIAGRKLVIMNRWDAKTAMRLIERERVTFFTGVPLMSHEIVNHPDRVSHDLSSCVFFAAGGAAQPVGHAQTIRDTLGDAFALQGYGLTETNGTGCTNFTENYLAKPHSTGQAHRPLVDIIIVGADGAALPPGEVGEIAIRSICNFKGYWRDPVATAAVLRDDGYLLTGDLGRLDEAGYLTIIDRKKDIIIRGGENIAAVEVEQAIYSHPSIAEASVFGLPDQRYGEVPVAVYHTKPGQPPLDARELQRHLAARIAAFKIPVQFWEQDQALPRLGAQKVDKRALRDRYEAIWAGARR